GHVGIYRALMAQIDLPVEDKQLFFDMLQRKAMAEIEAWVSANIRDAGVAAILLALPRLAGGRDILEHARKLFAALSADAISAVDELDAVADIIEKRYPEAELYFDLGELRG